MRIALLLRHRFLLVALLAALATPVAALPAWFAKNDHVDVSGIVTAPSGQGIENLEVVLEMIRETRDLRSIRFRKVERDRTPVSARTDATGAFQLTSPWSRYYNHLELVVGLTVQGPGGAHFQELERVDVTARLKRGGAAVIPMVVRNHDFVTQYRAFVATVASADENRTFTEQGRPDRVENLTVGAERRRAWWYFSLGRVYRFVDGRLAEVESFEPVAPIP